MRIREALLSDLDALVPLFDDYRMFYEMESDRAGAKEFLMARLRNNDSTIYVAEDGEMPVGFVQLYPLFSSTNMKRLWLLNDLYVEPAFRGRGASKLLIEEAKKLCRSTHAHGLLLETAKTNVIGNKLYPHAGFSLDTEHNYYFWKS